jgi:rare lipoprotein A
MASVSDGALAAQCGKAAWYDMGGQTASGERSTGAGMTAAHRTLPFGTKVRVENLDNGRSVIVRVNDRGPFVGGRVIDVTRAAAEELGMVKSGIAKVRVSVVDGKTKLDNTCADPSPRILTAEAVANDAARTKAAAAKTATPDESEPDKATAAATPSPNRAKPVETSGRTLVASVQYDEGAGTAPARAKAADGSAAEFTDAPQLDELDDARIVEVAEADVDIPLPRPRPAQFDDSRVVAVAEATSPAVFNRTLALRFLDAFAPPQPGMQLDVRALGYAPLPEPRGAIITE